ncbi:MAG: hypothetical protein JW774_07210 [Candidatus Aureabacteria bacterium]|nr:hypothetical protein [Candidatus Auribacterota bacterium]
MIRFFKLLLFFLLIHAAASPVSGLCRNSCIAPETTFNDPTEQSVELHQSLLSDQQNLQSLLEISEYLLGNPAANSRPLPIEYMEAVLRNESAEFSWIDPSRVTFKDQVVYIPLIKDFTPFVIAVSLPGNQAFSLLGGYECKDLSAAYQVKILPPARPPARPSARGITSTRPSASARFRLPVIQDSTPAEITSAADSPAVNPADSEMEKEQNLKAMETMISYLETPQQTTHFNDADTILIPCGKDGSLEKTALRLCQSAQGRKPRIIIIKHWPTPEISQPDETGLDKRALEIKQAFVSAGIQPSDLYMCNQPDDLPHLLQRDSKTFLVQEPLSLRRSVSLLENLLKEKFLGAVSSSVIDKEKIRAESAYFKEIAEKCLNELRWIQDHFPINARRYYLEYLPDPVNDSYDRIFRLIRKNSRNVFEEIRRYYSRKQMIRNSGFNNAGVFPDGQGSYFIDNWGMSGNWHCSFPENQDIPNRFLMRAVDAVSKALDDNVSNEQAVRVSIVTSLDSLPGDAAVSPDRQCAVSMDQHTVYLSTAFIRQSRNKQEKILRGLIGGNASRLPIPCPVTPSSSQEKEPNDTRPAEVKPSVLISQIAMVTELRSKDYHHYKCSQKSEMLSVSLRNSGYNSSYLPIEDPGEFQRFIERYSSEKQDIVVFSIYQIHRNDLEILHRIVGEIKAINPSVFIVLEGASTNIAKQFLAIAPEIDMMVRVESDAILPMLAAVKEKGKPLTHAQMQTLSAQIRGGIYIRSGSTAVISRFDTSNINRRISLPPPTRFMFDIWYTERGCANECLFCRRDQGAVKRSVPPEKRIEWLLDRLLMELDPLSPMTREELASLLARQSSSDQTLSDCGELRLHPDSFIGKDKIRIMVVSENALESRNVILRFARMAKALGLGKYFVFKIADTDLNTIMKDRQPDLEILQALHDLNADFIGFGTENPSNTYLQWWNKNFSSAHPEGYDTDQILKANKALIQAGINPTHIRHNLVLSFPEARQTDAKNAALLAYASPQYNSLPFYFGNGWGNNRFDRTFDVAASFCSSFDQALYAATYSLEPEETLSSVDFTPCFYAAQGTPEYMIRREFRFLKYIDERIPAQIQGFAQPTFYRYAQEQYLGTRMNDEDLKTAITAWKQPQESSEVRTLASLLETYLERFPSLKPLETLFLLKTHMTALECLSFLDYQDELNKNPFLPVLLETCGTGKWFSQGRRLTVPGNFNPPDAMSCFRKGVLSARLARELGVRIPQDRLASVIQTCLDDSLPLTEKYSITASILNDPAQASLVERELGRDEMVGNGLQTEGYLGRMSYPDQQAFENLRHLYTRESDAELFNLIVDRMNSGKIEMPAAVKELCCERLGIKGDDYLRYVKAVKEYTKYRVYYCEGGFFSLLRNNDPVRRAEAVEGILRYLEEEDNPFILRNIALVLNDLAIHQGLLETGVFIATDKAVNKLCSLLTVPARSDFYMPGPGLAVASVRMHNHTRLRMLKETAASLGNDWTLSSSLDRFLSAGDWVYFCSTKQGIRIKGTREYEEPRFKTLADEMGFSGNPDFLDSYIGQFSRLTGRHRLEVLKEIPVFLNRVKNRPHGRALMLVEENILYMLPLVKKILDNPDLLTLFIARSSEPFYNSMWLLMAYMFPDINLGDRSEFFKIGRTLSEKGKEGFLVSRTVNTLLTEAERNQHLESASWKKMLRLCNTDPEMAAALDEHLNRNFQITGGIRTLMGMNPTREQMVQYLSGFGLDTDFIDYYWLSRSTGYNTALMRKEDFTLAEEGYPLDLFKQKLRAYIRESGWPQFTEEIIASLEKGLDLLAGPDQKLFPELRNTLNNYLIMYGNAPLCRPLRNNLKHRARPFLNIVLENTGFSRKLEKHPEKGPGVIVADDNSSSGTTFFISELVLKAFYPQVSYLSCDVSQRTGDTEQILKDYGIVDMVLKSGVWPVEDNNSYTHGFFLEDLHLSMRHKSYYGLIKKLWQQQFEAQPDLSQEQCRREIEKLDRMLDEFLSQHEDLFRTVDTVRTLRHDPQVVKRQMLKTFLHDRDPLQAQIMHSDYYMCMDLGEIDFIGKYILADFAADAKTILNWPQDVPLPILEQFKKIRYAEQAWHLAQYDSNQREYIVQHVDTISRILTGDLRPLYHDYLSGQISFSELEKFHYQKCPSSGTQAYATRELTLDSRGHQTCSWTRLPDGKYVLDLESLPENMDDILHPSDPEKKAAYEAYIAHIRSSLNSINLLLERVRDKKNRHIKMACNTLEDQKRGFEVILFAAEREFGMTPEPVAGSLPEKTGLPAAQLQTAETGTTDFAAVTLPLPADGEMRIKTPPILEEMAILADSIGLPANNKRTVLVNRINLLKEQLGIIPELAEKLPLLPVASTDSSHLIRDTALTLLKTAGKIDRTALPRFIASLMEEIRQGLNDLEQESVMAFLIHKARTAKSNGHCFILGIESGLIPGCTGQHAGSETTESGPVQSAFALIEQRLISLGLDNVKFIFQNGNDLVSSLEKTAQKSGTPGKNIFIFTTRERLDSPDFAAVISPLKNQGTVRVGVDLSTVFPSSQRTIPPALHPLINPFSLFAMAFEISHAQAKSLSDSSQTDDSFPNALIIPLQELSLDSMHQTPHFCSRIHSTLKAS